MRTDSLPQARVFRKAGQVQAPPPSPRHALFASHARTAMSYAFGLWPLTCVLLLACGLLVLAARHGAP